MLCFVVLFGLAPALRVSKSDFSDSLKEGARGRTNGRHKNLGDLFVAGEIALCLILLVGSGLLLQSLVNLRRGDLDVGLGQPEKAMGHESPIEPWLAPDNRAAALLVSERTGFVAQR
jgi:hypothetical protein